jgi:hypothetical protein
LHNGGVLSNDTVAAYLARIGVAGPLALDARALRDLHWAHQVAVPFENLSIHLGESISLDEADLIERSWAGGVAASATSSTEPSRACSRAWALG